jgi:hypothetical protein
MAILHDQIIASACIDSNGFEITEEQLNHIFSQMPEHILMPYMHDSSKPPIGEAFNFRLTRLESDKRLAIMADILCFDESMLEKPHAFSIAISNAQFLLDISRPIDILFSVNPLYFNGTDIVEFIRLSNADANIAVEHRIERGVDVPAILLIFTTLSMVTGGFFKAMGADIYSILKRKIIEYRKSIKQKHNIDLTCCFKFNYDTLPDRPQILVTVSSAMLDRLGEAGYTWDDIEKTLKKISDIEKVDRVSICLDEDGSPIWTVKYIQYKAGNILMP